MLNIFELREMRVLLYVRSMPREPSTNIVVLLDMRSSYSITTEPAVSAGCSYGSADICVHQSLTKYKDVVWILKKNPNGLSYFGK